MNLLRQIQLRIHFLIFRPLGHEKRIPGGSLSDGRIEAENELNMEVIDFWEEENTVDRGEGDAIVGALPH